MSHTTKITFIGAGSTVFAKNIIGDCLLRPALANAHFALMDINSERLRESERVVSKMITSLGTRATVSCHSNQKEALENSDFVVVAFQIGGYEPCTVTDFEIPKKFGLRQTIGDTLGIGGIMRGLRTVPHLWSICEDMLAVCPDALMLQHVNPMAINTWAISEKYPAIKQVGLCHSVPLTAVELAEDLGIDPSRLSYKVGGINHMAFYLHLHEKLDDGTLRDLYPVLKQRDLEGKISKTSNWNPRCPNLVRYEVMHKLGYFVTESSEHFAEYVPWFIKKGRNDLIERFSIPLDEYPKRCVEQIADWKEQARVFLGPDAIDVKLSLEYASEIMNAVVTGVPATVYGNTPNHGLIDALPHGCAVEVPCLVDGNGVQPTRVENIPPQLTAMMRTNVSVQELTVRALIDEVPEHVYHAAMLDPHTGAELDLDQISALVDELIAEHTDWLPSWLHGQRKAA
ncbi:alpha-glucosidase/alpha-galactosidase [uncultured Roseibium sp.]|uniref:alpha-glucosidase/alpha-galactosidase n=1 Tax=uncultured Roseibium sp. TaxID=1936171 RepID=UPI002629AE6B|nr:alpha-glucosidase/alpha-galactosidase [uncultured Roseibium sp.]